MVFPGGGVDDRDRNADIAWHGPGPRTGGRSGSASTPSWPRRWSAPRRGRRSRSRACCSPDRPTIRTGIVDDASVYRDCACRAGRQAAVVRRVPARREAGAARRPAAAVGQLGDPEGGAHPPLRHLLLRRRPAGGPARRRRQHRVRPGRLGHARRRRSTISRRAAASCCRRPGPSWTRWPAAPSPRCWPSSARSCAVQPQLRRDTAATGSSSSSTATATTRLATAEPGGLQRRGAASRERSSSASSSASRSTSSPGIGDAAAVAAADQRADPAGVPRDHRGGSRTGRARRHRRGDPVRRARDLLRRRRHARAADPEPRPRPQAAAGCAARPSTRVAAIPKPTVAAITGYALGAGLTLALAADWRVSGDNVKFGATEILAGLVPGGGGTTRLARAVGREQGQGPGVQRAVRRRPGGAGAGPDRRDGGPRRRVRRRRGLGQAVRGYRRGALAAAKA